MTGVHSGWPIVALLLATLVTFACVARRRYLAQAARLHETFRMSRVRRDEIDRLRWKQR